MSGGDSEKVDIHVKLNDYQIAYLRHFNYNISAVLRDEVDAFIQSDGMDEDQIRASIDVEDYV